MPPLRERIEDIPELVDLFLARAPRRPLLTDSARRWLARAEWAGNVRELANIIERAVALCDHDTLDVEHLALLAVPTLESLTELMKPAADRQLSLAEVELGYIRRVLHQNGRNVSRTARILGIDRRTLYRKLASST
jgi:DNA-binding NtrC family response regulator